MAQLRLPNRLTAKLAYRKNVISIAELGVFNFAAGSSSYYTFGKYEHFEPLQP
jgi:hypothetical protein